MLVKDFRAVFKKELLPLLDEMEVNQFFFMILEDIKGLTKIDLALNQSISFSADEVQKATFYLEELKKQKPIQYLLGKTEFFGLPFMVNENVLIPRPETEELVQLILSNHQITKSPNLIKILDIGTGSGCIPISLKKNVPNAEVFAIDVSVNALEIAQKNADINGVDVTFIQKDILKVENLTFDFRHSTFDIIVSNPPYVRNLEKHEIKPNVLDYEPHLALFVEDDDALLFYRKITELAQKHLARNGTLYFEINQYLGNETVALVESFGFKNVKLIKDIYGNDRMILASYS